MTDTADLLTRQVRERVARQHELAELMATPAVAGDPARMRELGREHAEVTPIVDAGSAYLVILDQLQQAEELAAGTEEPELVDLARAEVEELTARREEIEARLERLLVGRLGIGGLLGDRLGSGFRGNLGLSDGFGLSGRLGLRLHVNLRPPPVPVLGDEPLHSPGRVDELLTTREEGVTVGADLDVQLLDRGARLGHPAACAGDEGPLVLRMYACSHRLRSFQQFRIQR